MQPQLDWRRHVRLVHVQDYRRTMELYNEGNSARMANDEEQVDESISGEHFTHGQQITVTWPDRADVDMTKYSMKM